MTDKAILFFHLSFVALFNWQDSEGNPLSELTLKRKCPKMTLRHYFHPLKEDLMGNA